MRRYSIVVRMTVSSQVRQGSIPEIIWCAIGFLKGDVYFSFLSHFVNPFAGFALGLSVVAVRLEASRRRPGR